MFPEKSVSRTSFALDVVFLFQQLEIALLYVCVYVCIHSFIKLPLYTFVSKGDCGLLKFLSISIRMCFTKNTKYFLLDELILIKDFNILVQFLLKFI